jgi:hypothetical protein
MVRIMDYRWFCRVFGCEPIVEEGEKICLTCKRPYGQYLEDVWTRWTRLKTANSR